MLVYRILSLLLLLTLAAQAETFEQLLASPSPTPEPVLTQILEALDKEPQLITRPVKRLGRKGRVTPLVLALEKGDVPLVRCLLSRYQPETLNAHVGVSRRPALHWLLGAKIESPKKLELVQELLQAGASPTTTDGLGATALHALVNSKGWDFEDFEKVAQAFKAAGAELETEEQRGYTPLLAAVMRHRGPVVKLLLKMGADPERKSQGLGFNARELALQQQDNIDHPAEAREVADILKNWP